LSLADSRTARVLITVLLFALVLGFLYVTRDTLIAFLFAIFFAYLMSPLVNRLEKLLKGRGRAIAVIYSLLIVVVVVFFVVVGPKVTREGAKLGQSMPALLEKLSSGELARQVGADHGWSLNTTEFVQGFLVSHQEEITQLAQRIGLRVADVAKQAWLFLIVPLLSIFFLKDGRGFSEFLLSTIQSRPQREFLENVLNDLNQMLAHFIRAQLTLAAGAGIRAGGRSPSRRPHHHHGGAADGLPALAGAHHFYRGLAFDSGLRFVAAHHGRKHGTASPGGDFRSDGRRRGSRHSRRLSVDSRDGQPAHRLPALAPLCRETQVRLALGISLPRSGNPPDVGVQLPAVSRQLPAISEAFSLYVHAQTDGCEPRAGG